jgi:hypothetical protein
MKSWIRINARIFRIRKAGGLTQKDVIGERITDEVILVF